MIRFLVNNFILICCFAFCELYSENVLASPEEAKVFVEKVSKDALGIITSNANTEDKEKQLSDLFIESVDIKWIAKFAMGKYWNQATETQRTDYLEKHKKFLLGSYIPKFREYNNQQIKIIKAYDSGGGEYLVETKIISADGTAVNIAYKVRKKDSGRYMVFDVIAEGVSMITTQRADFVSVLAREGIDVLIEKLGEKK